MCKFTYLFPLQSQPSESSQAPSMPSEHLFPPGSIEPTVALLPYPQLSLQTPHVEPTNMILDWVHRLELNINQAAYAVKKYKSHRRIPLSINMDINIINRHNTGWGRPK